MVKVRNQRNTTRKQRKHQHLLDVKVRSGYARRQRNLRVLAWLSGLLLVCASIGGALYAGRQALRRYFWQNPDYNLAEIDIHTDGALTRDQIIQATGIQEGKNIYTINLSAARKSLIALPQVERAEIERIQPDKISIDISERKPVAWIAARENADPAGDPGAFLIDRDGMLLRIKNVVPDYYHLPVICGLPVENYEAGQILLDLPEVKAALDLIHLTGDNPARYQVRSIDVSKGYCLVVNDERHARVTFPLDNLATQLDRLTLLFNSIDSSKREIQTVNLLVQRNVPVTFVPPPDPEPALTGTALPAPQASPSPTPKKSPPTKRAQPLHKTHQSHSVSIPTPIPQAHTVNPAPSASGAPLSHFSTQP